ncbi:hypothetical protein HBB16_15905 [Pseudonocardia sp. MCCB 268]|nr:hypothetical protein [Pseudonocardia cytotoxica]
MSAYWEWSRRHTGYGDDHHDQPSTAKYVDAAMRRLLRSPARRLSRKIMLLEVTGRKSGGRYTPSRSPTSTATGADRGRGSDQLHNLTPDRPVTAAVRGRRRGCTRSG